MQKICLSWTLFAIIDDNVNTNSMWWWSLSIHEVNQSFQKPCNGELKKQTFCHFFSLFLFFFTSATNYSVPYLLKTDQKFNLNIFFKMSNISGKCWLLFFPYILLIFLLHNPRQSHNQTIRNISCLLQYMTKTWKNFRPQKHITIILILPILNYDVIYG